MKQVDPSFGVTSAITIQDLSLSGKTLASETINPNLVSTSFSSKSELGLNLTTTATGPVLTFMGYAGGGVGNLDVSNSDTTAYSDPTNPVTSFYGPNYAFNRSVVALSASGSYAITQTLAYGGNNGRAAVLGPERPLLHRRQLQQRLGNAGPTHHVDRPRGRDAGCDAELDDGRSGISVGPGRQGGQGQQLPRADLLRRQSLFQQGQRQQRHRHGLYSQQSTSCRPRATRRRRPSRSCRGSRRTPPRRDRTIPRSASFSPTRTRSMSPTRAQATRPTSACTPASRNGRCRAGPGVSTIRCRPA